MSSIIKKNDNNILSELTNSSLVILMDCWKTPVFKENKNITQLQLYEEKILYIKNFCEKNSFVNTIGLATYSGRNSFVDRQNNYYFESSKNIFYDTTQWELLREVWRETVVEHDKCSETHPTIMDINAPHIYEKFFIWHPLQLMYYCNNVNSSIKNIYIVGFAWDVCIKYRPLGYTNILTTKKLGYLPNILNIASNTKCTLTSDFEEVKEVESPWKKVTDNIVVVE